MLTLAIYFYFTSNKQTYIYEIAIEIIRAKFFSMWQNNTTMVI